jgi:hypothetical protein
LDEFVARTTWEEACIQHLWRRLAADDVSARFSQLGRWWNGSDEIDLVGLWRGRATLIGECNWTSSPVGAGILTALQRKAQKLASDESPLRVLASRSGFAPALRRRAERDGLLLIEPADLFS